MTTPNENVIVIRELLRQAVEAYDALLPTLPGLQDKGSRWLRDRLIKATDDLRALLDAPALEINQCDGCMSGQELRGSLHVDRDGKAVMTCQSSKYQPPMNGIEQ